MRKLLGDAWKLAIEAMSWMELQKLNEPHALTKTAEQLRTSDVDALRLAHLLVYETTRRLNFINKFINHALKPKTVSEYALGIQAFLRLYVYQARIRNNWLKTDLKEAENIAKLVRAILGWKTLQEVEPFLGVLLTQKPGAVFENVSDEERIGLLTFHPAWFVKYCFSLLGRIETINLLEADLQTPPIYIRLNTLNSEESKLLEVIAEEGIRIEKVHELKYSYRVLATRNPLAKTECFREGAFYVQDKASCFAAEAADPRPGMTILDVCAAPGAKTTFLAQLMQNRGRIYSLDYSTRRMGIWRGEVKRMSVEIAEPVIADAREQLPFASEADLVILDPPCTGTGAFGKLPSTKWRLSPRSIERMAEIQWRMLSNCAKKTNVGGTLIYSTCSITVEENEMLVERLLKQFPQFALANIASPLGLPGLRGLAECRRLYPHTHQCNGFFVAKLLRREP